MTTSTRTSTTKLAADLEPGDTFTDPNNGSIVSFQSWGSNDDGPYAVVSPHRRARIHLDPSTLVNLEA